VGRGVHETGRPRADLQLAFSLVFSCRHNPHSFILEHISLYLLSSLISLPCRHLIYVSERTEEEVSISLFSPDAKTGMPGKAEECAQYHLQDRVLGIDPISHSAQAKTCKTFNEEH
jgi:hypothetical protein